MSQGWDRSPAVQIPSDHSQNPAAAWSSYPERRASPARADLTTLQRNEQIAEWIKLTEERGPEPDKPAQVAPVSKGGRGKTAGINAASRELGIERTEAQRAIKIASITPAANPGGLRIEAYPTVMPLLVEMGLVRRRVRGELALVFTPLGRRAAAAYGRDEA